jgi:hypothetical protein
MSSISQEVEEAKQAWKGFHKRNDVDWVKKVHLKEPFPKSWGFVGRCVTTYYASDKWQEDRDFFERYYHDSDKDTGLWVPVSNEFTWLGDRQPPSRWVKPPKSLAVLGFALGFDTIRHDNKNEGQWKPKKGSLLLTGPKERRLYVLEDGRITALVWGPKLRVEPRGIVG